MQIDEDSAKVKVPPPFIYLGMLVIAFALDRLVGTPSLGLSVPISILFGGLLFFGGTAIIISAKGLFQRMGTNVPPWLPATKVVTAGPYRWTRNPMYLGAASIYVGLAIFLDNLTALILLPLLMAVIQTQVIAREERYLEAKFGDSYRSYKAKVRRWI